MPTKRTPIARSGRKLTHEQQMSLSFGDLPNRPAFDSAEDRRAAWRYHGDRLVRQCRPGRRPAAWWDFDATIRRPRNAAEEAAALFKNGLLAAREADVLLAQWRAAFDRAQHDGFAFCEGSEPDGGAARWLQGAQARIAHYKWAGIPRELVKQWTRAEP
jgi:hypothetical protein